MSRYFFRMRDALDSPDALSLRSPGLLFGFCGMLAWIPAVSPPAQWFSTKRGLAMGICVSGAGVGGLALGPLTQLMLDSLGFRWTLRIWGIGGGIVCAICATMLGMRVNPPGQLDLFAWLKRGKRTASVGPVVAAGPKPPMIEWGLFKAFKFGLMFMACLWAFFGWVDDNARLTIAKPALITKNPPKPPQNEPPILFCTPIRDHGPRYHGVDGLGCFRGYEWGLFRRPHHPRFLLRQNRTPERSLLRLVDGSHRHVRPLDSDKQWRHRDVVCVWDYLRVLCGRALEYGSDCAGEYVWGAEFWGEDGVVVWVCWTSTCTCDAD